MGLKERVSDLMKRRGLNQSQLANLSGLTQATVSRILVGEVENVRPETLSGLAKALDVSVDELLGRTQPALTGQEKSRLVEQAFQHVKTDPKFQFGTRVKGHLSIEAKRFIIEMYERATGRKLLP